VLAVLVVADRVGARLWLDGGWGVDALLGGQTREHGDLDVAVEARHVEALVQGLAHGLGGGRIDGLNGPSGDGPAEGLGDRQSDGLGDGLGDGDVSGLSVAGFTRVGEEGARDCNFLLANPDGVVVDLHVIVLDAEGNGLLGPPEAGHGYPAQALTGRGRLGDRGVDCVSAEWVVRFHDAYPGDADDRADVRAL